MNPLPDGIKVGQVMANDLSFSFFEAGQSDRLVLCMHGFPDTPHCWIPLLLALADAGYRAVAPFMRGYSPTSAPDDGDFSIEALGQDVLALIEALGHQCADIVGHDWGASAVYSAHMQSKGQVTRVVGLAIPPPVALKPNPKILWSIRHFFVFQAVNRATKKYRADPMGFLRELYQRWSPKWSVPDEVLVPVVDCFNTQNSARHAISYYRAFAQAAPSAFQRATLKARLDVPSLFLAGDCDILDIKAWRHISHAVERGVPCDMEVIEGTGHFLQHEAPEQVASTIVSWLGPAEADR